MRNVRSLSFLVVLGHWRQAQEAFSSAREGRGEDRADLCSLGSTLFSPLIFFLPRVVLWPLAMRKKLVVFPWALTALYYPRERVSAGPV